MAAARSASAQVVSYLPSLPLRPLWSIAPNTNRQDWTKIYTGLGLGKETTSQLQAFRARHTSALNKNAALKTGATTIDLDHYKSILKDQSAVTAAEKVLREFKAVDYDVAKWDQAVDSFQGKAVAAAKETLAKIETEEKSLKETLSNISEARPFEDLTVSSALACFNPRVDVGDSFKSPWVMTV